MGIAECTQTDLRMSNTLRRVIIATKKAPDAIGPYNQAVQVNNTLYISGQIGFVPETMEVIKGGVVAEARQALTNMGHILEAAIPRGARVEIEAVAVVGNITTASQ